MVVISEKRMFSMSLFEPICSYFYRDAFFNIVKFIFFLTQIKQIV